MGKWPQSLFPIPGTFKQNSIPETKHKETRKKIQIDRVIPETIRILATASDSIQDTADQCTHERRQFS